MKFLKWFGLTIFGILLFISLCVFGLAFTANSTALNPKFVASEINNFPLSAIMNNILSQGDNKQNIPPEVKTAINQTITDIEPELKQELGSATNQIYDYLLGKKPNPEIADTLRNTILNNVFIDDVIDKVPIATVATNQIRQQIDKRNIPAELQPLLDYIQPAFKSMEPELKAELKDAAPSLLDYLVGKTNTFKVSINLQPVIDSLIASAKTYYTQHPPSEVSGVPQAQLSAAIDAYINQNIGQITQDIKSTYTIDETTLGTGFASDIHDNIAKAESNLRDNVRPVIEQFQRYYLYVILLIIFLIAVIIAIHHSVRGATRSLGSIFIPYGLIEFAGVILIKLWLIPGPISDQINAQGNMPQELSNYLIQFINHIFNPLMWFSLGVLIAGIVLLVVSFVYHPRIPEKVKVEQQPGA